MPSSELESRVSAAGGALTRLLGVRWMSRGRRAAIVAAVAGALTLSISVPALADPRKPTPSAAEVSRAQQAAQAAAGDVGRMQAKLARAQAQLQALIDDAERAVEAYNGALYELDLASPQPPQARARADGSRAPTWLRPSSRSAGSPRRAIGWAVTSAASPRCSTPTDRRT